MVFISVHLSCWLLVAITSAGTRGHVYETTSCHSKFVVDTKANVFRIVQQNLIDKVNIGLTIPEGIEGTPCSAGDFCVDYGGLATLVVTTQDHCQRAQWTVQSNLTELKDCVILRGHWYGGGEQYTQPWPIEKQPHPETAYITGVFQRHPGSWYGSVMESYWISSRGIAVVVSETTPLFLSLIDDDGDGTVDQMCLAARREEPYVEATAALTLDYYVCSADDVRQVGMGRIAVCRISGLFRWPDNGYPAWPDYPNPAGYPVSDETLGTNESYLDKKCFSFATILDPRFKTFFLKDEDKVKSQIVAELVALEKKRASKDIDNKERERGTTSTAAC